MKPTLIKALSIQIRLSGLSFCILNRSTSTIELFKHVHLGKKATPLELLNTLKVTVESHPEFDQDFETVTCIYQNELSCLVPKALFDEDHLADYLKFNSKILKNDFISFDDISVNGSRNVFVPLMNINNYLFDTYGNFVYKHSSTIFIETLFDLGSKFSEDKLYINVNGSTFEMALIRKQELIFYNSFEYNTKEDFIYYILFTIEQLKLDPETLKVMLSGTIEKDDELYTIVYKYIRFIDFVHPNHNFTFKAEAANNSRHNDFIILNSFN